LGFGHASSGHVINNVIFENRADHQGGGIYSYNGSHPILSNCIFWSDSAATQNEISVGDAFITLTYSNIQGGYPGEGNIDIFPLFRNPSLCDFHLMSPICGDSLYSPCIDIGNPDVVDRLLDCDWGLGNFASDMGAFGGGDSLIVGIGDGKLPANRGLIISKNYPNPFNAKTSIEFGLSEESEVNLMVCDIQGRRVAILENGAAMPAAYHRVSWDAGGLPSGVYVVRLSAGEFTATRKITLLK